MGAIATTVFGCKSHIDADRRHGFVRTWIVTDAARHDGRVAGGLVDQANTGSTAHRLDCLGGHSVSVAEQREENRPGRADPEGPFPPPARQADARASRQGRCRRVEGPIRDRTSLRRDEGTNGALPPHYRHRPGEGQDRHGQHRIQHETAPVPGAQRRRGMARPRRNRIPNRNPGKGPTRIAAVKALSSPDSRPDSRQQTGVFRVGLRWTRGNLLIFS